MLIDIELDNGVYVYGNEGASGKTYLAKLLKRYRELGEPVAACDYSDFCNGVSLDEMLANGYKLVAIDRYDMYSSKELNSIIEKYRKDSIILVDCKVDANLPYFDDIALLDRDIQYIRVY